MKAEISKHLTFLNFSAIILSAAIILMLIAPVYTPITIAGWVLVSLIDVLIKRKKVKVKLELVISGILYLFYVLGILWSENKDIGTISPGAAFWSFEAIAE